MQYDNLCIPFSEKHLIYKILGKSICVNQYLLKKNSRILFVVKNFNEVKFSIDWLFVLGVGQEWVSVKIVENCPRIWHCYITGGSVNNQTVHEENDLSFRNYLRKLKEILRVKDLNHFITWPKLGWYFITWPELSYHLTRTRIIFYHRTRTRMISYQLTRTRIIIYHLTRTRIILYHLTRTIIISYLLPRIIFRHLTRTRIISYNLTITKIQGAPEILTHFVFELLHLKIP